MGLKRLGAYAGFFFLGAVTAQILRQRDGETSTLRPVLKRAIRTGHAVSNKVSRFASEVKSEFDELRAEVLSENAGVPLAYADKASDDDGKSGKRSSPN
jgi:hypothetical protein